MADSRVYKTAHQRRRRAALAAGAWDPFVDAAPVREHVLALGRAGMGRRVVAELAGIDPSTVRRIRVGVGTKVQRHVAEAILAIPAHDTVAVERATAGKATVAHPADQRAAVAVLAAQGLRPYTIAQRIGTSRGVAAKLLAEVVRVDLGGETQ